MVLSQTTTDPTGEIYMTMQTISEREVMECLAGLLSELEELNLGKKFLEEFFAQRVEKGRYCEETADALRRDDYGIQNLTNEFWKRVIRSSSAKWFLYFTQPTRFILAISEDIKMCARETKREWSAKMDWERSGVGYDINKDIETTEVALDRAIAEKYGVEIAFLKALDGGDYEEAKTLLVAIAIMRKSTPEGSLARLEVANWRTDLAVRMGDIPAFLEMFYESPQNGRISPEYLREALGQLIHKAMGVNIECIPSPMVIAQAQGNPNRVRTVMEKQVQTIISMAMSQFVQRIVDAKNMSEEDFQQAVKDCLQQAVSQNRFNPFLSFAQVRYG